MSPSAGPMSSSQQANRVESPKRLHARSPKSSQEKEPEAKGMTPVVEGEHVPAPGMRLLHPPPRDFLSELPDELLHRICVFLDVDSVVRCSMLAPRWTTAVDEKVGLLELGRSIGASVS
jgi:hypothetical protein